MLKHCVGKGRHVMKQLHVCLIVLQYDAIVATESAGYVLYRALVRYAIMRTKRNRTIKKSQNNNAHYTWSYCKRDRSASKRSVCLAEHYSSLSLERAREKYAADIYGLPVSIFSINHLY